MKKVYLLYIFCVCRSTGDLCTKKLTKKVFFYERLKRVI